MSLVIDEPLVMDTPAERASRVPRGKPHRPRFAELVAAKTAGLLSDVYGPLQKSAFGILMYHRIANHVPEHEPPTWNVPPSRFEAQLSGLLARGWKALPLREVIDCVERNVSLPRKTFVVTFDDGYANNLTNACPILTRLAVPATVFLSTAYLDSSAPFPSDNWSAAGKPGVPKEAWRPLTTEECHRLIANGLVELGAHTHTHADFRGRPDALREDLQQNLAVLRDEFGIDRPTFAFPYGTKRDGFASSELSAVVRQAGAMCSLTTERCLVRRGDSPFDWGRFAAHDCHTAAMLAGYLSGWYSGLRSISTRLRRTFRR
jgi:peptidoglycan/xylan/chitin deacetylase (PgdA/CDA1 family)